MKTGQVSLSTLIELRRVKVLEATKVYDELKNLQNSPYLRNNFVTEYLERLFYLYSVSKAKLAVSLEFKGAEKQTALFQEEVNLFGYAIELRITRVKLSEEILALDSAINSFSQEEIKMAQKAEALQKLNDLLIIP